MSGIQQLAPPAAGETVAVIRTGLGEFRVKFFPQFALKAVENFLTHGKNGYYNGTPFHRVIFDFMIQGGDPQGNGTGGESIWGGSFADEYTEQLHHYRGALSMANRGRNTGTNGSQFFVVHARTCDPGVVEYARRNGVSVPESVAQVYQKVGGTPWLDLSHTIFGQVYTGLDVVDRIASVAVDGNDRPLETVEILGVDVLKIYKEQEE